MKPRSSRLLVTSFLVALLTLSIAFGSCITKQGYEKRYTHYKGALEPVVQHPWKIGRYNITLGTHDIYSDKP